MTDWVFLSTHFDDVVLSCGGMVWELARQGNQVEIWTICAGDAPEGKPLAEYAELLHKLMESEGLNVPLARSLEDATCCQVLGAGYRRYTMQDCIYRYHMVTGEPMVRLPDDISAPLEPEESYLIPQVADFIRKNLRSGCELVSPIAIGHHRDHVLTRKAADQLGIPIWHYVDYPYVTQSEYNLADFIPEGAEEFHMQVSHEGLKAWQDGFACHKSQIAFLFGDDAAMREGIKAYSEAGGGSKLYRF